MSDVWVKNVSFSLAETSEIVVVLKRHLKEIEEVLDISLLDTFLRKNLVEEAACVKNILKKLNMEV